MLVYRCTLRKWSSDLTGTGAFLYGGRWNRPGSYLLYTAENNVLAAFEVALRVPLEHISKEYIMVPIEVPDLAEILETTLPRQWYGKTDLTQEAGENFIREGKALAMKVPSALISDSYNILINPRHPMHGRVKVHPPRPILFDKRLTEMIRK